MTNAFRKHFPHFDPEHKVNLVLVGVIVLVGTAIVVSLVVGVSTYTRQAAVPSAVNSVPNTTSAHTISTPPRATTTPLTPAQKLEILQRLQASTASSAPLSTAQKDHILQQLETSHATTSQPLTAEHK